jgi:acetylornithine aminotransferase
MNHILECYEIVRTDIVRGQGCYLYDVHNNRYLDFEAGVWCAALGHNHPRINEVMREQLDRISHLGFRYTNELAEEAAVEVLDTVALSNGKCTFLSSGSEAVEFGVQTARRLAGKPLLLALAGSYLAAYGSASRKSPEEWCSFDWNECITCLKADECDPRCRHLQEIPFERIGGLVFEPGNTYGLVKLPSKALVQNLANRIEQQGGLLVIDEVTTGLGRTGAWYGFEHYDLRPDIVALGKGLGNGYPVSAVVMTHDIADRLENSAFRYAQSHQNDPLGCVVAKEVIAVIRQEGLIERSKQIGAHFVQKLEQLGERHKVIKEIRGRGLMLGLELDGNAEHPLVTSVYRRLLERGIIVGYSPAAKFLRFYPPLTIGENDIAQLVENLDDILPDCGTLQHCVSS